MTAGKLGRWHQTEVVNLARRTLSRFMLEQAERTAEDIGFGWRPAVDAPDEFGALQVAYASSQQTGQPLPVSSEHNGTVIYTSPTANMAFRFVHDVQHIRLGLSFELLDELELALWHLDRLEAEGFSRASLPWRMLHADLIGQAHFVALATVFPGDQRRFVEQCLQVGFDHGLVAAVREHQRRGVADHDAAA